MEILDLLRDWLMFLRPNHPPALSNMRLKPEDHAENALMVTSCCVGTCGSILTPPDNAGMSRTDTILYMGESASRHELVATLCHGGTQLGQDGLHTGVVAATEQSNEEGARQLCY